MSSSIPTFREDNHADVDVKRLGSKRKLFGIAVIGLALSGCAPISQGLEVDSIEPQPTVTVTETTPQETATAGLSLDAGCTAFGGKLGRMGTLMDLLIDAVTDGESTSFLASDFRDVGEEVLEIGIQAQDSELKEALERWGTAQINFSEALAGEGDTYDLATELQLATAQIQGVCPDL